MSGENLAPARTAWIAHLETCPQCNYDRECMECVAGDGTGEHACNCKEGGEGYALAKAVEVERVGRVDPVLQKLLARRYPITLYPEDVGYTAEIRDLYGCMSQGETAAEAVTAIDSARVLWITYCHEKGTRVPDESAARSERVSSTVDKKPASREGIPQADEAAFLRNEVRELRKTLAVAEKALEFTEPIAAHLAKGSRQLGEVLHSWGFVVDVEPATLTQTHINKAMAALLQIREALREPVSK